MVLRWIVYGLLLSAIPGHAQEVFRPGGIAEADDSLVISGYRALFTCSGHFFAGRSWEEIERLEMVDNVKAGFPPPIIDKQRQLVIASSSAGDRMIAAFRDSMGCTLLPPDWDESKVPFLPYITLATKNPRINEPFPVGDRLSLPTSGIATGHEYLGRIVQNAFDGSFYAEGSVTIGLIIIQDGKVLTETYRNGFGKYSGYRTWSTAKSITASIIGIAVGDGVLATDEPVPIPEWQFGDDPRQKITLKNLLQMSSGLVTGGSNSNAVYFGGQDVISAATSTPLEAEPGTRWRYSNNDTLLLLRALRARLKNDLDYLRFPYEKLLHPIGMYSTRMEVDYSGNFIGSSQVYTTARDLARFGLLLARDGEWLGRRILPRGWVEFVTTPASARAPEKGEWGYGAQFWLLDAMPGVPEGTYTTAGNKGQFVTVVPKHNLVVVRTGVDPAGVRWDLDEFIADLVKLLE